MRVSNVNDGAIVVFSCQVQRFELQTYIIELGATNARRAGRERRGNLRGGCVSKLCVE